MRNSFLYCLAVVVSFGLGDTALAQAPAASGAVITIAGNGAFGYSGDGGPATNAMLANPGGSAMGPDGSIYFSDVGNRRIRRIDPVTRLITTVAGNGLLDCGDGYGAGDGVKGSVNEIVIFSRGDHRTCHFLGPVVQEDS